MSRKPTKVRPATPMEEIPDKVYFRIGEAADLVGVESHVLRYWETEFGLKPTRTPSGQRRYRKEDVEAFLRVRHLLHDQGFTIAGARKSLSGEGEDEPMVDSGAARDAADQIGRVRGRIAGLRAMLKKPLGESADP